MVEIQLMGRRNRGQRKFIFIRVNWDPFVKTVAFEIFLER